MLSLAFVALVCVTLFVSAIYYLRPSRGAHANPRGAAVSVAWLLAEQNRYRHQNSDVSTRDPWAGSHALLCGYDSPSEPLRRLATVA